MSSRAFSPRGDAPATVPNPAAAQRQQAPTLPPAPPGQHVPACGPRPAPPRNQGRTPNAFRPQTPGELAERLSRLPKLRHGQRWTILPGDDPYRVRAAVNPGKPNRLRVYDVTNSENVLHVNRMATSPNDLPPARLLYHLLTYTRPTPGRERICWSLTQTPDPETGGSRWLLTPELYGKYRLNPRLRHALSRPIPHGDGPAAERLLHKLAQELITTVSLYRDADTPGALDLLKGVFNTAH